MGATYKASVIVELQAKAEAWVDLLQARLSIFGYKWYDATTRNLLLSAKELTSPQPVFEVVDYTLVPLCNQVAFSDCLAGLENMEPAESRQTPARRVGTTTKLRD